MGQGWETKTQMVRPGGARVWRLGARTPAFAFSKGVCLRLFLFALVVSFFTEVALSSPLTCSGALPAPSDRTRL